MPRVDPEQALQPSILDRLIDLDPKISTDPTGGRPRTLYQIKAEVKRDLEALLNTKQSYWWPGARIGRPAPEAAVLLDSLLSFGLPDFSNSGLSSSAEQERLRKAILQAVERFEPRLTEVAVTLVPGRDLERAVHFRIDALLRVDPAPEPVTFDSVLQLHTRAFEIKAD